jgi:hypothetical protein
MEQNLPTFFDLVEKSEIAQSLNIPLNFIDDLLPIEIVST